MIILIVGAPASGKSTFLSYLVQRLGNCSVSAVSGDAIEQYIQTHDHTPSVQDALQTDFIERNRLLRHCFNEGAWRRSREWVEENAKDIVRHRSITIFEDDYLLKSQRKPFRRIAEMIKYAYIELLMDCLVEECVAANAARESMLQGGVVQRSFEKLQIDSKYMHTLRYGERQCVDRTWLEERAVMINGVEQKTREQKTGEQKIREQGNNNLEEQLRKYIGKLMRDRQFAVQQMGRWPLEGAMLSEVKRSLKTDKSIGCYMRAVRKRLQQNAST